MREGAFALVDCLGFKGIWTRHAPEDIVRKLTQIQESIAELVSPEEQKKRFTFLSYGSVEVKVKLLSDTAAISLQYEEKAEPPTEGQKNVLVYLACLVVAEVCKRFLDEPIPLVLRGCISYGQHISDGNFIIGPAVDEAAKYMDIADGSFTWLTRSAGERYWRFRSRAGFLLGDQIPKSLVIRAYKELQSRIDPDDDRGLSNVISQLEGDDDETYLRAYRETMSEVLDNPLVIKDYDMPLKSGAKLRCSVLNPIIMTSTDAEITAYEERYRASMDADRLDVWLKAQNTLDLIHFAKPSTHKFNLMFPRKSPNGD